MISRSRTRLKSWILIYVGLAAAIVLAGHPSPTIEQPRVELPAAPPVPGAPLVRRDI